MIDPQTGEWVDAQDSRVCVMCRTLGATYNTKLESDITEEQVERALDAMNQQELEQRVQQDSLFEEELIKKGAGKSIGGIGSRIADRPDGMSVKQFVETEIERGLEAARQTAQVPAVRGRPLEITVGPQRPGAQPSQNITMPAQSGPSSPRLAPPVREAVTVTQRPGAVKPEFVSVTINTGNQHNLFYRDGRYFISSNQTGRVMGSFPREEMWKAFSTFALLEKASESTGL